MNSNGGLEAEKDLRWRRGQVGLTCEVVPDGDNIRLLSSGEIPRVRDSGKISGDSGGNEIPNDNDGITGRAPRGSKLPATAGFMDSTGAAGSPPATATGSTDRLLGSTGTPVAAAPGYRATTGSPRFLCWISRDSGRA
jgi:hypothetical protein